MDVCHWFFYVYSVIIIWYNNVAKDEIKYLGGSPMEFSLEKQENNRAFFNIEISTEKFEEAVQKTYLRNRNKFNIPGFRRGKTPRKIIEMNYGEGIFYEDAINEILPEAYDLAIADLGLEVVSSPEVDIESIEKGKPIVIKVEVDVKPEVKLGDYQSIELEKIEYNVTDELIDAKLEETRDLNSRLIEVEDRTVEKGDILTINYEGFMDGESFSGGKAENHQLEIGSNSFIPGFEDQLIGKNKGEDVEIQVTFPEDYHAEDLAGKEAIFKVKIHGVKVKELPDLDDEFAKDVSEYDTLQEYKDSIKKELEESMKNKEKTDTENRAIERAVESSEVEIPEGMIETRLENEVKDFEYRLRMQGLDFESYLKITNSSIDDLKEQFRPNLETRIKTELVLEAIGKKENMEATDEDIEAELEKLSEQYAEDDKEKFKENMKKGDLSFLHQGIINNKVIDLLVSNVKFI